MLLLTATVHGAVKRNRGPLTLSIFREEIVFPVRFSSDGEKTSHMFPRGVKHVTRSALYSAKPAFSACFVATGISTDSTATFIRDQLAVAACACPTISLALVSRLRASAFSNRPFVFRCVSLVVEVCGAVRARFRRASLRLCGALIRKFM